MIFGDSRESGEIVGIRLRFADKIKISSSLGTNICKFYTVLIILR